MRRKETKVKELGKDEGDAGTRVKGGRRYTQEREEKVSVERLWKEEKCEGELGW